MRKIIRNAIKCNHCGDVIESTHVHDFKWCSCGTVAVDGGKCYCKRSFKNSPADFTDMSEWEDVEDPTPKEDPIEDMYDTLIPEKENE